MYRGLASIVGDSDELQRIKEDLKWVDYDLIEDTSEERHECLLQGDEILVPRAWAYQFNHETTEFDMVSGYRIDVPMFPILKDDQVEPVDQCIAAFEDWADVILQARTGSGKTVMGTYIAAELGCTTLIIVDQNKLKKQWIKTLVNLFGYSEDEIGIIQGPEDKWTWDGYDFTIAMVQTLYDKDPDDAFLDYFGTMVVDEFDAVGAEQYSNVFSMMPAQNRLSVSATDRSDGRKRVVEWHLGGQRIILKESHKPSQVRYIEYRDTGPSYYANRAKVDGRYISELAADGHRNLFICEHLQTLYNSKRTILAIGARVHHLECLHAMMLQMGIPEEDMLVYTGTYHVWQYQKVKKPVSHPPEWDGESDYIQVEYVMKEKKSKIDDLDAILEAGTAKIVFATYAIFSKGVDCPTLDTGMDVTPKSKFEQIHGRILRELGEKFIPIWVTIRDVLSYRAEYQFAQRLAEFAKSNVEVFKWDLLKGLVRKDVDSLRKDVNAKSQRMRNVRIVQNVGGRNQLQVRNSGNTKKRTNVTDIRRSAAR